MQTIGMNETMITAGEWVMTPLVRTRNPTVAARL
jgi:hypothetical protein